MTVYSLYNLDMGKNPTVRTFEVGPYKIKLLDDYDNIRTRLSANIKQTYEPILKDQEINFVFIDKTPAQVGESIITATASIDDEPEAKLSSAPSKSIWDLCLIFSYLLGRRIYLTEEERRFGRPHHGFPIVEDHQIVEAANISWANRQNFESEKQKRPLWYYLHLNDTPEAELKMLIGCVALEIIQNIVTTNSPTTRSSELEELIKVLTTDIESSKIEANLKQRLISAVGNWGETSSNSKFQQFLNEYGVIGSSKSEISSNRIDSINDFRNGIVHSGEIRLPKWIQHDGRINVAMFYAGNFIPSLIQEYLNRKFGIHGVFNWTTLNHELLKEYILSGTWGSEEIESPNTEI